MRKLCWFSFSFALAALLCVYLLPVRFTLLCGTAALGLGLVLYAALPERIRRAALLTGLGLAAGFAWFFGYDAVLFSQARGLEGGERQASAVVWDFPVETDYGSWVDVKVDAGGPFSVLTRAYFFDDPTEDLRPGDKITFSASFGRADSVEERRITSYTSKGYLLFARNAGNLQLLSSPGMTFTNFHRYLRRAIQDRIHAAFPEDTAPFMRALLTGDRTEINEDVKTASDLERAGISHIIAVSGMHVSILAGFLLTLFGKRRWAVLTTLPVLAVFMAVSGFSASVVRAVIMQTFILLAPLIYREADSLTALAFALLVLLLFNPYAAAGVSLQLSFAATLGIILLTPRLNGALGGKRKGKDLPARAVRFVAGSLSTTLGALAFTLPISAFYFGCVSLIAPLSNLLILWAVTPAFVLGALSVGTAFLWLPLGRFLAVYASWCVRFILFATDRLASPFLACVTLDGAALWWFVAVYVSTAAVFLLKMPARRLLYVGSLAVISLCVIFLIRNLGAAPGYTMTVLDVGQGECIVVSSGDSTAVIDCGTSGWEDAGELAERYIRALGRGHVDALILTHYHADHANGAERLLAALDVSALIVPEPRFEESGLDEAVLAAADRAGCQVLFVTEVTGLALGETQITLYPPMGMETENERGIAALVDDGEFETLVLGDMPGYIERQLAARYDLPDIECLVAAHHGSRTSTTDNLLDAVTPEVAVISVGENSYGHPTQEVLDRLTARGIEILRTDQNGNITITSR